MKIISIANHKGGVGKTAVCHGLGVLLAKRGHRVLMVDCDPQASLTGAVGLQGYKGKTLANVLDPKEDPKDEQLPLKAILKKVDHNLAIAPAGIALSRTELKLFPEIGRENALKNALSQVASNYDIGLLDCPPSLGILTVNALNASHGVLVPTQPQVMDLYGLRLFLDTIEEIQARLNEGLELVGIVLTFHDPRLLHHQNALEVMQNGNLPIAPASIGRSVRVAEAAAAGQSVVTYAPENPQTENFELLTEYIETWLRKNQG